MSILFSLLRQCLVLLPVVWILPHFVEDHLFAVWVALPASDIVTQLVNLPFVFKERRVLRAHWLTTRECPAPSLQAP